jgi:hypothetical protein
MAIGADMSLRPNLGAMKPPLAPKPAAKPMSVPSFAPAPTMIPDGAVQDMVNNQLAAAAGSGRAALAAGDRAGVSRGAGQQRVADMAEATADVTARSGAAQTEMGAAAANANARSAFDNAMRNEQLQNTGLLEQLRSNVEQEKIAKTGWQQNLREAMRRGQFSLTSGAQLDYGPLYQALFQNLFS